MFKLSKWIVFITVAALMIGAVPLAGCNVGVSAAEPVSVTVTPTKAYNPILTQHTLVAVVKDKDGTPVAGASVEWILNRAPDAVGDIVSLEGDSPKKIDNTYGVVKTDSNGEASVTITSTREGDTDVTAYVPGITDPANHKWFAVKHWLDLTARFPDDAINAVDTTHTYTVQTVKVSDGTPVGNVPVRFTITDNDPAASFSEANSASNTYTVKTDAYGFAAVTLVQNNPSQGSNTVKIDVLAPFDSGFVLVSKDVIKEWQATNLNITKDGPAQVTVFGNATYTIDVNNTGDLTATGVVLTDEIPEGMTYVSSSPSGTVSGNTVTWNIGSLNKDASKSFTLVLKGAQPGLWTNTAVVHSNEVGTATAQATTRVMPEPEVVIKKTGPSGVFTGFTRAYTLTVTNTGAVALNDVVVTDYLPDLLSYNSSVMEATVTGNQISWNLGTLQVGQTKEVVVILSGVKSGTAVNTATVTTREGATSTDSLGITVLGSPGAHMSLIDSRDPVAVGEEYTYIIKVLNQDDENTIHNMNIVGLIPNEAVFVSAEGQTAFTIDGKEVRFGALETLLPGQSVEFKITVKATAAGSAVFNATMNWDEFGMPIVSQEGTTIFLPQD